MDNSTIGDLRTMSGGGESLLAGRYRVVRPLGQGGMGAVWLAEDTALDGHRVAVKTLPAVLVSNRRAMAQLKAEALVALRLSHSNIATLRSFEENGGNPFLVIDYVDGRTLDDVIAERGRLTEEETIRLLKPIASALDYAHAQGVVHRDVKPGNVMVRSDGTPFILDFGIAREIQETLTRATGRLSSGTLMYMSPEQLHGAAPKPAQDVYSFAAMVYECLSGSPPFFRGQVEFQILNDAPPPLASDTPFARSVMRGLSKDAAERPDSCLALFGRETGPAVIRPRAEDAVPPLPTAVPRAVRMDADVYLLSVEAKTFLEGPFSEYADGVEPRLDADLRRTRTLYLAAQTALQNGDAEAARRLLSEFLEFPDRRRAQARELAQKAFDENRFDTAFACARAADASDPSMRLILGYCRQQGLGTDADPVQALADFRAAAEAGHPTAQYNLATMLLDGAGVERDVGAAVDWYRTAADRGVLEACIQYGDLLNEGKIVPQNAGLAFDYYLKVHKAGDSRRDADLGGLCARGEGADLPPETRRSLIAAAARVGDADALALLEAERRARESRRVEEARLARERAEQEKRAREQREEEARAAAEARRAARRELVRKACKVLLWAGVAVLVAAGLIVGEKIYRNYQAEQGRREEARRVAAENERRIAAERARQEEEKRVATERARQEEERRAKMEKDRQERAALLTARQELADLRRAGAVAWAPFAREKEGTDTAELARTLEAADGQARILEASVDTNDIARINAAIGRLRGVTNVLVRLQENLRRDCQSRQERRARVQDFCAKSRAASLRGEWSECWRLAQEALAQDAANEDARRLSAQAEAHRSPALWLTATVGGVRCTNAVFRLDNGQVLNGGVIWRNVKVGERLGAGWVTADVRGELWSARFEDTAVDWTEWERTREISLEPDTLSAARARALGQIVADMVVIPGKDYRIGKTEVTQAQWEAVMGGNPSQFKGPDRPVERVSWNDCQAFVEKLNGEPAVKKAKLRFRLPTSEEWEHACRAGGTGDWGRRRNGEEGPMDAMGWYGGNSGRVTHPVAQKEPNAWGLHDMHGNVLEWTSTASGSFYVYRGGCWSGFDMSCKAAYRIEGDYRSDCVGFRLAASVGDAENKVAPDPVSSTSRLSRSAARSSEADIRVSKSNPGVVDRLVADMVAIPWKDYRIGKTEVTQAQWEAVMGGNPSKFKDPDRPVERVSWNDCQAFIEKLNGEPAVKKAKLRFRLPTSEEWEHACRAGGTRDWGRRTNNGEEGPLDAMGWYVGNSGRVTHPVAQKEPNAWGLYDMHGNVMEWTSTAEDSYRVICGGSWYADALKCRSAYRTRGLLPYRSICLGFRLLADQDRGEDATSEPGIVDRLVADMVPIPGKDYRIGKTEVTQEQWEAVMGGNPSKFKGPDLPVEMVSWNDCQAFVEKLNGEPAVKKAKLRFRLPTSEEWEHACRAGGTGDWGRRRNGAEGSLDAMGWYVGNSGRVTHPVAQKEPNAWGLYDMHGNVWEWTATATSASRRVYHGGGCLSKAEYCMAGVSRVFGPDYRFCSQGFRLLAVQDR